MINSITLYSLRNSEFIQFLTDFLAIVLQKDPTAMQVKKQYDAVAALENSLEALFKTDKGSDITDELIALDLRRDNAFNGISTLVSGYSYSTDAAVKQNSKLLTDHLALFGIGIAKDNYQSETATLRNIIADWTNKPELKAALTALNLISLQTELEAANTAFGTKYLERAQEVGAVSPDTIKAKRLEAANVYYKLRDALDAHFTLEDGAEPYASTINSLNALIDSYNTLLANRKSTTATSNAVPVIPVAQPVG